MRDDILKYLRSVASSTAKTISDRIGAERADVARELNALTTEGIVEREKRGADYHYWLSLVDGAAAPVAGATSVSAAPATGVGKAEATAATPRAESLIDTKLRELGAAKAEIERLKDALKGAAVIADSAGAEINRLKSENATLQQAADDWKRNCARLEQRIDELTIEPLSTKSPLFVTVGRYAKPMRHDSLEKAQKRAAALVRGEKESRVLILEPVGSVIRGSEWRPTQSQRGAQ